MNAEYIPYPLVKINSMQATASSRKWSNVVERIRREYVRKTILKKIRAKAVRIWRKAKATIFDSKQMVSALAWIKNCDMYNYYREYIKPFIDFGKMKHKISTADRKVRCIEHDRI